ncbi:hypothetical protein GOBAR_AA07236 [Gossypium barbadense]|uniref:Uncharacterized protein n=1 Tax=Gossypium barbadense TaxID=3634 RepID=A0A2P5YCS9_GOSBA|nr:hypothetical protein GOBAR_AA07236 [Gossypium barbadense]
MDDIETFQYVEDQSQTVGANVKQFCSSSGQSTENERGLAQACKNEAHDTDSTLDDALLESKAVPKLELETVPAPVPSQNKVKHEESCIVVDNSELHSLSNELQERRSFKVGYSHPPSYILVKIQAPHGCLA